MGLIGRSGAGKSTIVNLLLRFYEAQEGSITIDGQNVLDVSQESLRSQIGLVTQDTSLLHRSVRDNIIYGRPTATDEEMINAAKRAEAADSSLISAMRKVEKAMMLMLVNVGETVGWTTPTYCYCACHVKRCANFTVG